MPLLGLGCEKIQAGEIVSPEALDATYIRRSDAEVKKGSGSLIMKKQKTPEFVVVWEFRSRPGKRR